MIQMTLELSLLDLADFDSWRYEKPVKIVAWATQEFDSLEPLQQVALEDSWRWEETLMK